MSPKRIKQLYADFQNALERLKAALAEDPKQAAGTVLDGTVQRFEFTFELGWKLAKQVLAFQGIEAGNPRDVIKEGFQQDFFKDGDAWIAMLEDRNRTSHVYDEAQVLEIYNRIKKKYYPLFEEFRKEMERKIKTI
jgi:nucleotidyltransferase substrate binding protein (TIGR01987 family)